MGVLAAILVLIAVNYMHYKRKRTAWIAKWVSAEVRFYISFNLEW